MDLAYIANPDFGYNPKRKINSCSPAVSEDFLGMKKSMDTIYCAPKREPTPASNSSNEFVPFFDLL